MVAWRHASKAKTLPATQVSGNTIAPAIQNSIPKVLDRPSQKRKNRKARPFPPAKNTHSSGTHHRKARAVHLLEHVEQPWVGCALGRVGGRSAISRVTCRGPLETMIECMVLKRCNTNVLLPRHSLKHVTWTRCGARLPWDNFLVPSLFVAFASVSSQPLHEPFLRQLGGTARWFSQELRSLCSWFSRDDSEPPAEHVRRVRSALERRLWRSLRGLASSLEGQSSAHHTRYDVPNSVWSQSDGIGLSVTYQATFRIRQISC